MWFEESVFYQIYPLGLCGAPRENDGVCVPRIRKVLDFVPHIQKLGANAVYFSPVFQSDAHGYDTRDYTVLDCRLGTNQDFAQVCRALHDAGIRVVLDGVFNHVGRGFWAFQDVLKNRENSPYKDWFFVHFDGNNGYNDGLWYESWEGHFELVKLNLRNNAVVEYLFSCIRGWVEEFDVDGLRLDVAYCLDQDFLRRLSLIHIFRESNITITARIYSTAFSFFCMERRTASATETTTMAAARTTITVPAEDCVRLLQKEP